jgi:hypothetical protein
MSSGKFEKVTSVLNQLILPSNTKKVNFAYRNYAEDIFMSKEKLGASIDQANASASTPAFGTTVVYSINPGNFVSKPYLYLTITGDTTAVSTNMLGFNCIDKIEVWHGIKLMEYSGETLAQVLMNYAQDDETRTALQTFAGGAGSTLAAQVYEYCIPLLFCDDPHSILGGNNVLYPTHLINADLQFKVTYKAQAKILSTVGTVTGFTNAQLRYTSTWMNQEELKLDQKDYELFVYDIRQIQSAATACVSGTFKEFDLTSFNEDAEIMDILFKCISSTNVTALQMFQATQPTSYKLQINSHDWYIPDTITEAEFNNYIKQGYNNYLYSTYKQQKADPYLHVKSENTGMINETYLTNGVNLKNKTIKLFLNIATATYTLNFVAILKKKLKFSKNSIQQIYVE